MICLTPKMENMLLDTKSEAHKLILLTADKKSENFNHVNAQLLQHILGNHRVMLLRIIVHIWIWTLLLGKYRSLTFTDISMGENVSVCVLCNKVSQSSEIKYVTVFLCFVLFQ